MTDTGGDEVVVCQALGGTKPLLLHVFPGFGTGGAQRRFCAISNRFGNEFRHVIIAIDGNLSLADQLDPSLHVAYPKPQFDKTAPLANLLICRRLLCELQPDLLITSNWGSIEWAMANRLSANLAPLVRHLHMEDGFGPEEHSAQLFRRVLTRRLLLQRSIVLLPSRNLLRIATQNWRLDQMRLRYIPNGVDLHAGAPSPLHSRLWPDDGLPVIGTVAVLRAEKNLSRLLRAFKRLEVPARLVIVGDGPARASLQALSQQLTLGDQVHFIGHVAAPQPVYLWFDIFALSSDTEQMPLSILEAMSASLPVASTDVGDIRQMLAEENAPFIVPREDAALAAALTALLRDPELRRRVGQKNRARAERDNDQETMFQNHRDLWLGGE
jgi:glycosyltransferase involved in cell wall biosynthesis